MSKILEVNDLCKSFVVKKRLLGENDVVSAVNHVSLGLEEGEVLGIVGEETVNVLGVNLDIAEALGLIGGVD